MAIAILKSQFTILDLLHSSATCQTYRGCDSSGRFVFVKVLNQPQQFFDELARYLATDFYQGVPYLLANFPPATYGSEDVLSETTFGEAIGFYAQSRHHHAPELLQSWELSNLGILVTEWIEGQSAAAFWDECGPTQKLDFTRDLADHLAQLHALGEHHGNLQWSHVLIEKCSKQVKLVGLGHFPGKQVKGYDIPAPEHFQDSNQEVGPATDVYLLAKLFLAHLESASGHPFLETCLHPNPDKRPKIDKVVRFLRSLALPTTFTSSPVGLGLYCLTAIAMGFIALAFSNGQDKGMTTNSALFHSPSTSSLAQLLQETRRDPVEFDPPVTQDGIRFLDEYDLRRPIAVLVFQRKVFLIGRNLTFAEGDRVYYRGSDYVISQLSPRHIQLTQSSQNVSILFDIPENSGTTNASDTGVYVWDNPNNVIRFLQGIAEVSPILHPQSDFPLEPLLAMLARLGEYSVETFEGNIQGQYADGNFSRFLGHLDQLIQYKVEANTVTISASSQQIRL